MERVDDISTMYGCMDGWMDGWMERELEDIRNSYIYIRIGISVVKSELLRSEIVVVIDSIRNNGCCCIERCVKDV